MSKTFCRILTVSVLGLRLLLGPGGRFAARFHQCARRHIPARPQRPSSHLPFKAPNAQKVQLQPGGDDNGLGKGPIDMIAARMTSECYHFLPPSPASTITGTWWTVWRSTTRQRDILRMGPGDQRRGRSREGRRFLRGQGRSPRRHPRSLVFRQDHCRLAPRPSLYASRVRSQPAARYRCFTCSMAPARTSVGGPTRAAPISFSTT